MGSGNSRGLEETSQSHLAVDTISGDEQKAA